VIVLNFWLIFDFCAYLNFLVCLFLILRLRFACLLVLSLCVPFRRQEQTEDDQALQERDEADICALAIGFAVFRINVKVLQRPGDEGAHRNNRGNEKIIEMQCEGLGKDYADGEMGHVEQLEELEVRCVA